MPMPIATVYRLKLINQPGIEIVCRSAPLGTLLKLSSMSINRTDEQATMKAFGYFAKRIIEWNVDHPELEQEYEDDELVSVCSYCGLTAGERLPTTARGLACVGVDFALMVIAAWITAVSRVSPPKEASYSNGETDIDPPIPTLGKLQNPISSDMLS